MRTAFALFCLAALPVLGAARTSFQVGARVVQSATLATAGATVRMTTRAPALVQVGAGAPVRAQPELSLRTPAAGDVVVTLLY